MWASSLILTGANLATAVDYRCIHCGNKMFTINRNILALWLGQSYPAREIPLNMGWLQHKCKSCPAVYNIYWQ